MSMGMLFLLVRIAGIGEINADDVEWKRKRAVAGFQPRQHETHPGMPWAGVTIGVDRAGKERAYPSHEPAWARSFTERTPFPMPPARDYADALRCAAPVMLKV